MIKKAVKGGHCGAEYVFAVISIFEGGISMRVGLMYIANMKKNMPVIVRICRHHLRCILNRMWVQETTIFGERPICCTVHQHQQNARKIGWSRGIHDEEDIHCELCFFLLFRTRLSS